MSNLKINIRIFSYHFQVNKMWKIEWIYNPHHIGYKNGIFKVYEFNLFA